MIKYSVFFLVQNFTLLWNLMAPYKLHKGKNKKIFENFAKKVWVCCPFC
jgi:hypothetical protein